MTALLALQRATIGYPGSPVLLDVSLEIRQGDAVAVLGPNGSGKTTLLKTFAGILPPLKGSFRSVSNGTRSLGRVGYIPQRTSLRLLLPLTVHEVVEMGTYGRLKPWQQVGTAERDRIEWALGAVGMVPLENECYSNLSGGQQQRVLIARALVTDPQVLILDEPLASLDQQSVQGLMGLLGTLRVEKKVALLWADHFVPALRGVVSEAIRIEGNTVLRGTLEEMLSWEGLGRSSEPTGTPS